jgi:hypothetical protein
MFSPGTVEIESLLFTASIFTDFSSMLGTKRHNSCYNNYKSASKQFRCGHFLRPVSGPGPRSPEPEAPHWFMYRVLRERACTRLFFVKQPFHKLFNLRDIKACCGAASSWCGLGSPALAPFLRLILYRAKIKNNYTFWYGSGYGSSKENDAVPSPAPQC